MVLIEEIVVEEEPAPPPPSQERLLDAEAIEQAAASMTRPSAKMHLEALAKKLRKESAALKRVEESQAKLGETASLKDATKDASAQPDTAARTAQPPAAAVKPEPTQSKTAAVPPAMPTAMYTPIDRFSFDAGGYNSSHVTLYIPLPGVGSIPRENTTCDFTPTSFDLVVRDLNGKSYRLNKDNLDKDIDPEKCKYNVKADKIVLKLAKVKNEYGYDMWTELSAKKKKKAGAKDNPAASIMELMKDMYDSGDDNMKKMIGETMMKQRRGELDDPMKGGMGGLDHEL